MVSTTPRSQHTAFHALAVSGVITGGIVLVTAGDLGPWAPMLLALGLYLIVFCVLAEGLLALAAGVRWLSQRRAALRQLEALRT